MSQSILLALTEVFEAAFAGQGLPADYGKVTASDRPDLAPFQCNGAMAAAGYLKKQGQKANPRVIAQSLVEAVKKDGLIAEMDIAGPGFINIVPEEAAVEARANVLSSDPRTGAQIDAPRETIIVDYGGANVAKPMHVGHLRSAVIGECLKRLLRFRGDEVIGDVHLGDWGLQMGHLITELEDEQPGLVYFKAEIVDAYPADSPVTMDDLARLYPAASNKAKQDPARMERSRTATAELQAGRPGYRALLEHFITVSIASLKQGYGALGVDFDLWKGEASVDPLIAGMIDGLIARGVTEDSDGALIIRVEEDSDKADMPPLMLRASSGAVLYHTTDMATLLDRKAEIDPDKVLYVVDQRQALHFEQVFRGAVKAGWYEREQLDHLGFGTMNGPDGKPFKTRAGGVLRLDDLLSMMEGAARERLKQSGLGQDYGADELADIATKVGIAALKFADLQNVRTTNYVFDLERFTAFEGKTGPYLLYAAVRIKSLLKKAKDAGFTPGPIILTHAAERALILALDSFDRESAAAKAKYAPHIICDHVYRLAQSFSRFYTDCPVLADATPLPVKSSRLALAELTLRQLELGLDILGIEVPDRM